MSSNSGFKSAGRTNPLSAEYVEMQRDEVIKKYQQEVVSLQDKIIVLKAKAASLDSDLVMAFSDRLKLVEGRESASNLMLLDVEKEKRTLENEKNAFLDQKRANFEENNQLLMEIKSKIKENENLIKSISDRQALMDQQELRVNDYGTRIAKLEGDISARSTLLDGREKNIEKKREEVKLEAERLSGIRQSIHEEEEILSVSRSINKNQSIELDDLRRRLEVSKSESEFAIENLLMATEQSKQAAEQNKIIIESGIEIAKGNKEKEARLVALENELRVMEKDIKQKKQDLDEREARIKDLEKGGQK